MNEETRRILDMLAQGKITVSEAGQLLDAVEGKRANGAPQTEPATAPDKAMPRFCRVTVIEPRGDGAPPSEKVNIRVPFSVVRSGVRLGALLPGLIGEKAKARFREEGIDVDVLKLLDQPEMETILRDLGELIVDVNDGKAQVRVRCE